MEGERTILRPFRVGTCMGPCSGGYRLRPQPPANFCQPSGLYGCAPPAGTRQPKARGFSQLSNFNFQTSFGFPCRDSPLRSRDKAIYISRRVDAYFG